MRVEVDFGDRVLDLELPDEQVVGVWRGPVSRGARRDRQSRSRGARGTARLSPLRQAVVPGDRVTIALDPEIPDAGLVVGAIAEIMRDAGVEGENLTVLVPSRAPRRARRIAAGGGRSGRA